MGRKNGILDWFKFESKAAREKRERAYYGRMFPFGKEQRDWEVAAIADLFPDRKKRVQEIHFALLTLRENLLDSQLDEEDEDYITPEEAFEDWVHSDITRQLIRQGIAPSVYAMALLENTAESPEELPTAEKIRSMAEEVKVKFKAVK